MLTAFTVENYRSFEARTRIELRPLTILLGRNSSGKSTLTRTVPLLKQSLDKRTAVPMLWNSEVVDFGSIGEVINHSSNFGQVSIGFEINARDFYRFAASRSPSGVLMPSHPLSGSFVVRADFSEKDGRTVYDALSISYGQEKVQINWNNAFVRSVTANGVALKDFGYGHDVFRGTSDLFPTLLFRREIAKGSSGGSEATYTWEPAFTYPGATSAYDYFVHKTTSAQRKAIAQERLVFVPFSGMRDYIKKIDYVVKSRYTHDACLSRLSSSLFVHQITTKIAYCSARVNEAFESASYLGPARASGSRYYRYQELSVDQIDWRGENLPMYLSSLTPPQLQSFNDLFQRSCGYKVRVARTSGHASIEIAPEASESFENLADVGFGFSQYLPIVAQIHAAIAGRQRAGPGARTGASASIIAIEQPELHLHPAFQSGLGDLFSAAIAEHPKADFRFLIETHSEALVSRVGDLVASGSLKPEDVVLYFVTKDEGTRNSSVSEGGFSEGGQVTNWPPGFFSGDS